MMICPDCSNIIECNSYKDRDTGMWSNQWECSVHGKVDPITFKNIDLDHIQRDMAVISAKKESKEQQETDDWVQTVIYGDLYKKPPIIRIPMLPDFEVRLPEGVTVNAPSVIDFTPGKWNKEYDCVHIGKE